MNLLETQDATKWADEWLKTIKDHSDIPQDRDAMITWFANAIMAGYDHGRRAEKQKLNAMLDVGLRVFFFSKDFIQVTVENTAIWWHGRTIDEVYEIAKLRGFIVQ